MRNRNIAEYQKPSQKAKQLISVAQSCFLSYLIFIYLFQCWSFRYGAKFLLQRKVLSVSVLINCNVSTNLIPFDFLFPKKFIHELIYQTLDNKPKLTNTLLSNG